MANRKISDLTALTAPATGDLLPIVDISEAAAADKNKKITYGELLASAPAGSAAAPSFSFDGDPNTGIFNPAADTLAFAEGGAEAMRLDSSGRLLVGTTTANTSGGKLQTSDGLTFPATAVASADPNTLDDYEEGTWTPVLADADTGGNTFTHAVQNGLYTKVGNVVTVYFRVTWTSKESASGVMRLRGFPFTSKSTLNSYWHAGITVNTNGQNIIRLAGNGTVATFADTAGADGVATEFSASDTTAGINGSMTYLAT
jgi:hypothetical protein